MGEADNGFSMQRWINTRGTYRRISYILYGWGYKIPHFLITKPVLSFPSNHMLSWCSSAVAPGKECLSRPWCSVSQKDRFYKYQNNPCKSPYFHVWV